MSDAMSDAVGDAPCAPEGREAPDSGHSRVTFRLRDDVLAAVSREAQRAGMPRSRYLAGIVERAQAGGGRMR